MPAKYGSNTPTPSIDKPAISDSAPDLAALLKRRIDGGERTLVRDLVCLDPVLYTDRIEAADRDDDAEVERIDAQILASSVRVTLRPLAPSHEFRVQQGVMAAAGEGNDVAQVDITRAVLAEAFVTATDRDGNDFPHLTTDAWRQLLAVMTIGELNRLYRKLGNAEAEPDFPSSPRQ